MTVVQLQHWVVQVLGSVNVQFRNRDCQLQRSESGRHRVQRQEAERLLMGVSLRTRRLRRGRIARIEVGIFKEARQIWNGKPVQS